MGLPLDSGQGRLGRGRCIGRERERERELRKRAKRQRYRVRERGGVAS